MIICLRSKTSSQSNADVGWLFWVETVFQSISGRLPERENEKRKDT